MTEPSAATRYPWTQPICRECWNERNPDRQAVNVATLHLSFVERCCHCNARY